MTVIDFKPHSERRRKEKHNDIVQPFMVDKTSMRGRIARLQDSVTTIISRHNYPDSISKLLGELITISSLLGANLKINGILTIQLKSDGIIKMMVADSTSTGDVRGYAEYSEDEYEKSFPNKSRKKPSFKNLLGKGYLVITFDPGANMDRYQGIVELSGKSFSDCVHQYFINSEQLQVTVKTAVKKSGKKWIAGGIMLERMPEEGGTNGDNQKANNRYDSQKDDDDWTRLKLYIDTVTSDELTSNNIEPKQLAYRLFHEDGVWVFDEKKVSFGCRCSREKIQGILDSMPEQDIEDMKVDGKITVTCQFCNKAEIFS